MEFGFDSLDVLVVDDDRRMRLFLRTAAESFGVSRVREASDGAVAYEAIVAEPPDLLVTDYQMEPVDGVRLIRRIRRTADDVIRFLPIIMATACAEPAKLNLARDAGVNVILRKPVSLRDLADGISAICHDPLPFIRTRGYFGPERRRGRIPGIAPGITGERRAPCRP